MPPYESLQTWQQAHQLHLDIRRVCRGLEREDRIVVGTQLWRAALSVPNNIAEGSALGSDRMFHRHLTVAQGSLAEVRYLLLVLRDLGLLAPSAHDGFITRIDELARSPMAFRQAVNRRLRGTNP